MVFYRSVLGKLSKNRPSLSELKRAIESFLADNMGVQVESGAPFANMGVDSMAILKILLFLEKEFGIYLPDSELTWENIRSIDSLAAAARAQVSSITD